MKFFTADAGCRKGCGKFLGIRIQALQADWFARCNKCVLSTVLVFGSADCTCNRVFACVFHRLYSVCFLLS